MQSKKACTGRVGFEFIPYTRRSRFLIALIFGVGGW
jgi:hypothetical protein